MRKSFLSLSLMEMQELMQEHVRMHASQIKTAGLGMEGRGS